MIVLGINAYHGDASAAIVVDGELVAAVEEERFTRVKHDTSFPTKAVEYCLHAANATLSDVEHIALSRNPRANLGRRARFAVGSRAGRSMAADRGASLLKTLRAKESLAQGLGVPADAITARAHFVEHHLAHIASSFFVSPFEDAAVLSLDGFGDMVSAMWGVGRGSKLSIMGEVGFPHSLGVFYTAFTQYLGFPNYGDEYKVMGLASYGEPEYLDQVRQVVRSAGLGYELNLDYFSHHLDGVSMTWRGGPPELGPVWGPAMESTFGPARHDRSEPVEARHENVASSMQRRLEEVVIGMIRDLHRATGLDRLCMAGGVALNCVANGRIRRETPIRELYIQPAANDAGTSVGAAYHVYHHVLGAPRGFVMDHAYYGPEFDETACRAALDGAGLSYRRLDDADLFRTTAKSLADGKVVGWFQGRMEFGPRALGNRSILVDPRRAEMKDVLNARIKHREPFRPFAPSILESATGEYFEDDYPSPYMLLTYPVRKDKRDAIPAPTHVDGTGRLQTVRRDQNARYHDLIAAFGELTGVPVLLNTSFNENEPICHTPEEAADTFRRTKMDVLVLGNLVAER
ncbi:MAG TPA: carbamoyltransferase C-terminal domain-containing protein [Actinomycetota bacterium]|jgi:carbamoyltransferase